MNLSNPSRHDGDKGGMLVNQSTQTVPRQAFIRSTLRERRNGLGYRGDREVGQQLDFIR